MQQLMIVGYQPPYHYYSLLSGAARPTILQRFKCASEEPNGDMMDWMFPAVPTLYDEHFQHKHRLVDH